MTNLKSIPNRYPATLERNIRLKDGTRLVLRPIRDTDAEALQDFVRTLSDESRRQRFMSAVHELDGPTLSRFTHIDYAHEMALAVLQGGRIVGTARYMLNPDVTSGELALVVADDMQRRGIGTRLMRALITSARERGLKSLHGLVSANNDGMLALMERLGFAREPDPENAEMRRVMLKMRRRAARR